MMLLMSSRWRLLFVPCVRPSAYSSLASRVIVPMFPMACPFWAVAAAARSFHPNPGDGRGGLQAAQTATTRVPDGAFEGHVAAKSADGMLVLYKGGEPWKRSMQVWQPVVDRGPRSSRFLAKRSLSETTEADRC